MSWNRLMIVVKNVGIFSKSERLKDFVIDAYYESRIGDRVR